MRIPAYLYRLVESYFHNRQLQYMTGEGLRTQEVSAGVPQGSILGPVLWNITYDELLRTSLPSGAELVGFADDVVLLARGSSTAEVELLATVAIQAVERWMHSKCLRLAHHKTEMVLITNLKSPQTGTIAVGPCNIVSKRAIKYLGVMIDDRLSFTSHVEYVCKRAAMATAALTRMMPNSSAIQSSKRRILASVTTSILRYGAAAWRQALGGSCNLQRLSSVQRLMNLRVISGYRTMSSEAACVVAGVMPISVLLEEDVYCYDNKDTPNVRDLANEDSMSNWQQLWDSSTRGRWTHRLIPHIGSWIGRRHGEVDFYMTQFLTGHGCFMKYHYRFGHVASPYCPDCGDEEETPEHVVFVCPRFAAVRTSIFAACGPDTTADNVVRRMCADSNTWHVVSDGFTRIMTALQRSWNQRQSANGVG